ncbi:MAG: hemolysin family protein [Iamia sp.]
MSEVWVALGAVVLLVLVNGLLSGTEVAVLGLRESQLQRLDEMGRKGRALAALGRDPHGFRATVRIGITLAAVLAAAVAALTLADPLERRLDVLGDAARPVAIGVIALALAFVTLVLGEMAPKRIARQRAEGWALAVARPASLLVLITRPAAWALQRTTDLVVRLTGGDPDGAAEEVTEEELRDLVTSQPGFTDQHRTILSGAFEIAGRTLIEVIRPRRDVFVVAADETCEVALRDLACSSHTRAPVAEEGNLDEVLGTVHLRDLVDAAGLTVREVAQPAPALPETGTVLDALRTMQAGRHQMAIVINEHGGTEGIVTVEDLLEELVGEIYDETDQDILDVRTEPDGARVLPGRFPWHDLPDIDVTLPDGPYSTVAGLVLHQLGRIPDQPGDVVVVDGWHLEVLAVDGLAISEVRLRPDPEAMAALDAQEQESAGSL